MTPTKQIIFASAFALSVVGLIVGLQAGPRSDEKKVIPPSAAALNVSEAGAKPTVPAKPSREGSQGGKTEDKPKSRSGREKEMEKQNAKEREGKKKSEREKDD